MSLRYTRRRRCKCNIGEINHKIKGTLRQESAFYFLPEENSQGSLPDMHLKLFAAVLLAQFSKRLFFNLSHALAC